MEEYENRNEDVKEFDSDESQDGSYEEDGHSDPSESYEEVEAEETEFSLTEGEIDEWINELTRLKEEKTSVDLEIDEQNILKVNFEEGSHGEEDSENFENGESSEEELKGEGLEDEQQ